MGGRSCLILRQSREHRVFARPASFSGKPECHWESSESLFCVGSGGLAQLKCIFGCRVAAPVTRRRPHRSEHASFSHSALPESIQRLCFWDCPIRVDDCRPRQWKATQQLQKPRRKHPRLLAATSECALPYLLDLLQEALHGPAVPGQTIVGVVAAQNCGKPLPLIGDRYVHSPSHLKTHLFELADHPFRCVFLLTMKRPFSVLSL